MISTRQPITGRLLSMTSLSLALCYFVFACQVESCLVLLDLRIILCHYSVNSHLVYYSVFSSCFLSLFPAFIRSRARSRLLMPTRQAFPILFQTPAILSRRLLDCNCQSPHETSLERARTQRVLCRTVSRARVALILPVVLFCLRMPRVSLWGYPHPL